jgi:hypothetical protein
MGREDIPTSMTTCIDVALLLSGDGRDHCDSCHEDEEYGYPMCGIVLPDGEEVEVCCVVRRRWDTQPVIRDS